jgi:hypothetical protein
MHCAAEMHRIAPAGRQPQAGTAHVTWTVRAANYYSCAAAHYLACDWSIRLVSHMTQFGAYLLDVFFIYNNNFK